MDDLDSALAPNRAVATIPDLVQAVKDALMADPLGEMSLKTADDRIKLVRTHSALAELGSAINARRLGIEHYVARDMAERGLRKLIWSKDAPPIVYEPVANTYSVKEPQELRDNLLLFVEEGALSAEEVDDAVHPEVTWRVNNLKLNALRNRGERVAAVIAAYRIANTNEDKVGSVKFPR